MTALERLKELVDRQAEDEGLWFEAMTAPEAYLQQELRALHEAVEAVEEYKVDANTKHDNFFRQIAYDAGARGEELDGLAAALEDEHIRYWRKNEQAKKDASRGSCDHAIGLLDVGEYGCELMLYRVSFNDGTDDRSAKDFDHSFEYCPFCGTKQITE